MNYVIYYNNSMPWYKDKILWKIIAVCASIKLVTLLCLYFFGPLGEEALAFPDSITYVYPAQTFLTYGQFWEAVSATPLLMRTPGYPVFLALIQLITGNMTWAVVAAQNILSLVLLLPVYLTTRRLAGQQAARWAAGFCAASVLYFSLAFAVLTETLCVFLLAWFVFLAVRWLENPRTRDLIGAAVLLAAAVYVRPAVYYFVPVAFVLLIVLAAKEKSRALFKQATLYFILPLIVLIGVWQVRNYRQTGYGGFTSVGAYNLYIWNEDFIAKQSGLTVPQAHQKLLALLPTGFDTWSASAQVKEYKRLAAPLLKQSWKHRLIHWPLWAGKTLLGTNHVHLTRLLLARADEPEKTLNQTALLPRPWLSTITEKLLFVLAFLQITSVVFLGSWGLWLLAKTHVKTALFLGTYVGYFWVVGSGFFGTYARLRAPFELVLCITAGIAASTWIAGRKNSSKN